MKVNELREKNTDEVGKIVVDLLKEQFELRMGRASGQMTRTHKLKLVRRDIARAKTILKEKQGN